MSSLHRTQVYIEEAQLKRLKLEAIREHLAVSELIRNAIDRFLKLKEKKVNWDNDVLSKAIGKIKLNVDDASVKHDRYLYE
ncbi:MAG: ribbon-helix-helix protein, CopG family [Candidatus Omnitrophota bacterium]